MSLINALSVAKTGITSAQTGIDLVSRNIANASTDGYTRKVQQQTNFVVNGLSSGVRQLEFTRFVSDGLFKDVRDQRSTVHELDVLNEMLGRLEGFFGRPSDNGSIAAEISELKESFGRLSTTPNLATTQEEVIRQAEALANTFVNLSSNVQDFRLEVDARIDDSVNLVNQALEEIVTLNTQIQNQRASGQSSADLDDQRDQLVLEIAEQMDIRTFERPNGELVVLTGTSRLMIDEGTRLLDFSKSASASPGSAMGDVNLSDGLPIGSTTTITSEITSGKLAGLIDLRDTIFPEVQAQLDDLAYTLAVQFDSFTINGNVANLELFHDSGTGAVPVVGNLVGMASRIEVNTNVSNNPDFLRDGDGTGTFTSGGDGDPSLPLAILDMFETSQTFNGGNGISNGTLEGYAAEFIGYQANQKADFESRLSFQEQLGDALQQRMQDESAVNIDEEMANLIELQNSFAASARVLSAVQQAMDELLAAVR